MPIFDFKCPKCGSTKDDELVSGDASVRCDVCNEEMTKLMGSFSFTFTPHGISTYKKKMGNVVKPETMGKQGGVNLYGVPRTN